ncbi:MAG: DEAD/DEAH box helicase, partial [Planctomycetota bacterium]
MTSLAARDILGEGGAVARAIGERYEARDEQLRMASSVGEAMDSGGKLLVEAGTGVGKSFAYLVPAMLRAARHGQTVVVATHTIALQEQLVEKDIPALQAALADAGVWDEGDAPVRPVLVKGRGNYVSIRRLKLASQRQKTLLPDAASRRSLHQIEDWAYATTDGTLSTLPQLERPGVWDKAQSDSANCMGRRCPHHAECFYQRARKEMEGANILVCNHALFFSDLALRTRGTGFLPVYQHVVLDEAHAVEDVAAEHFGVSLTEGRVQHLLST